MTALSYGNTSKSYQSQTSLCRMELSISMHQTAHCLLHFKPRLVVCFGERQPTKHNGSSHPLMGERIQRASKGSFLHAKAVLALSSGTIRVLLLPRLCWLVSAFTSLP